MQSSNAWPALSNLIVTKTSSDNTEISLILLGWIRVRETIWRDELNFQFVCFFFKKIKKLLSQSKHSSISTNCPEGSPHLPDKSFIFECLFSLQTSICFIFKRRKMKLLYLSFSSIISFSFGNLLQSTDPQRKVYNSREAAPTWHHGDVAAESDIWAWDKHQKNHTRVKKY